MERRRFKQSQTLKQRLVNEVGRLRDEARLLPPGRRR